MTTKTVTIDLGEYQLHEVPLIPLSYGFLLSDSSGPFDISNHASVLWWFRSPSGVESFEPGLFSNNKTEGLVQVAWTEAMTNETGRWRGIFWLYPGPVASKTIFWRISDGPGPA